jgi:hypothetical protein
MAGPLRLGPSRVSCPTTSACCLTRTVTPRQAKGYRVSYNCMGSYVSSMDNCSALSQGKSMGTSTLLVRNQSQLLLWTLSPLHTHIA